MLPDYLSAALRGLSFIAMAQATGAALFLVIFGSALGNSRLRIRRAARAATTAALILVSALFLLEAARMAGSLSGLTDWDLQAFALSTPLAKVAAVRILALGLLCAALASSTRAGKPLMAAAALLLSASFALVGHTAGGPARWLLAPAVALHVLIVAFWFGSLLPRLQVVREEEGGKAVAIVAKFSHVAGLAVPLILLAGLLLAFYLLPDWQAVTGPYGLTLLGKLLAFGLLMALAAWNRWRLGPALAGGAAGPVRHFCLSITLEWWIIAAVLIATAVLTAFLSP
ncbi:MAG: CopD family protein [Chloroflexota bacterium]|nr:CopD family protein [Chloroflexota bacterium]